MGAESDISDGFEGGGATSGGLAPLAPRLQQQQLLLLQPLQQEHVLVGQNQD